MKHVFTIHSSLTFLVAYFTARQLQLSNREVVFISSNYRAPECKYNVVESYADRYSSVWYKISNLNLLKNYDNYIEEITENSEFIAYVDLMSTYQRILITHSKCKGINFMEEGNSAYMAFDDLNDLTWEGYYRDVSFRETLFFKKSFYLSLLRILRGYNYRTLQIPYHYMAYVNFKDIKFYCISLNAFYNAPEQKKIILKPDQFDPLIGRLAKGVKLENEIIWIDGSNSRFTGLPEKYYYEATDKALAILKARYSPSKIYLKLRPGISDGKGVHIAEKLTEMSIKYEILPGNINLECLFIKSTNCKVVGVLTAALEYAYVFGHQAYSIYNLFEKQPPTFFDRMEGFWKNVKKLNP
ncbi:MAG: alpha-2,8-polysialyltransferase family protein [Balneolales bacterium]|nr:alpha-2,8-polysialyltransferase family protein [Balneolales bacterium]